MDPGDRNLVELLRKFKAAPARSNRGPALRGAAFDARCLLSRPVYEQVVGHRALANHAESEQDAEQLRYAAKPLLHGLRRSAGCVPARPSARSASVAVL